MYISVYIYTCIHMYRRHGRKRNGGGGRHGLGRERWRRGVRGRVPQLAPCGAEGDGDVKGAAWGRERQERKRPGEQGASGGGCCGELAAECAGCAPRACARPRSQCLELQQATQPPPRPAPPLLEERRALADLTRLHRAKESRKAATPAPTRWGPKTR